MRQLDREERDRQIHVLYQKLNSMEKVADALGISKSTVHKALNSERRIEQNAELANEVKKIKEDGNKKLLDLMQSHTVDKIVANALGKLNDRNLNEEIKKRGVGNIYRIVGMFADKVLAIKDHDIRLQQLEIKKLELQIKQQELELRISNPDAFHEVHIINDADAFKSNANTN